VLNCSEIIGRHTHTPRFVNKLTNFVNRPREPYEKASHQPTGMIRRFENGNNRKLDKKRKISEGRTGSKNKHIFH